MFPTLLDVDRLRLRWHIGSLNARPAASFVGSGHSKLAAGVALNNCRHGTQDESGRCLHYNAVMSSEHDKSNENPYEPSSAEDPQFDSRTKPPKVRTLAASLGLVVAIFLASGVAFGATCTVGAFAGLHVSQAAGAVSEGAMGYGVMTGITVGIVCSLAVAVLLSRRLFRVP